MGVLDEIVAHKRAEVAELKARRPMATAPARPRMTAPDSMRGPRLVSTSRRNTAASAALCAISSASVCWISWVW